MERQIEGSIKIDFLVSYVIVLSVFARAEIQFAVQAKSQGKHAFPAWNDEKAGLEAVHHSILAKNGKIGKILNITARAFHSPLGIAEAKSEDGIVIKQWPVGIFA